MGNDLTYVTNRYGERITIEVLHSNGKQEILTIDEMDTRRVITDRGDVTIAVFSENEGDTMSKQIPCESKTIPSNKNVVIVKDLMGLPRIRRSRSWYKRTPVRVGKHLE